MRMELLILAALKWRLRSITPFSFIDFFAYKLDSSGAFIRFLISRATEIILATLSGTIDTLDTCISIYLYLYLYYMIKKCIFHIYFYYLKYGGHYFWYGTVIDILDYWPSCVAAAAILAAADAIPNLSLVNPENAVSWCVGLSNVRKWLMISDCGCVWKKKKEIKNGMDYANRWTYGFCRRGSQVAID